jgi:hypothetical protein
MENGPGAGEDCNEAAVEQREGAAACWAGMPSNGCLDSIRAPCRNILGGSNSEYEGGLLNKYQPKNGRMARHDEKGALVGRLL